MIISYKHKFIFIKTRKTAGSTIELILRKQLGPDDIATKLGDEKCPCVNCNETLFSHTGHRYIAENWPNEWKNYYKFAVDRNPWDKIVSAFFYWDTLYSDTPGVSTDQGFKKFAATPARTFPNDWNMYSDSNKLVVDQLLQYENLHKEFPEVCKMLGVPYNNELDYIKAKAGFKNFDGYQHLFNDDARCRVEKQCKPLIDHFNYKF